MSGDNDEPGEPSADDTNSGDGGFAWSEEESEALWQALLDAELTASADEMPAFLKQIDTVAPLRRGRGCAGPTDRSRSAGHNCAHRHD